MGAQDGSLGAGQEAPAEPLRLQPAVSSLAAEAAWGGLAREAKGLAAPTAPRHHQPLWAPPGKPALCRGGEMAP